MTATDIILLNFSETRRRSTLLWEGVPEAFLDWKPDHKALSIIEMIRHVLEGEHLFHTIIKNRGNLGDYKSPWTNLEYSTISNELNIAITHREAFLNMIKTLHASDLENTRIDREEVGQSKSLGDYLNRMVYHESVHTGQLLAYLRTLGVKRPLIWD